MRVLIRTDASGSIGTGHLMRCLALADGIRELDPAAALTFASAELPAALEPRLAAAGVQLVRIARDHDREQTLATAERLDADWVVLDGYTFAPEYVVALGDSGRRLLLVDDLGEMPWDGAAMVLNQNLFARGAAQRGPRPRLLFGPRFALLRREFASYRDWRRPISAAGRHVLVTLGGADPGNATEVVVKALRTMRDDALQATVVLGATHRHEAAVRLAAQEDPRIRVVRNVADMAARMAEADLAVAAAGTTSYELCFMQLPAALTVLADNQLPVAESLCRAGAAANLGIGAELAAEAVSEAVAVLLTDAARRTAMADAGKALVDGRGAERVARAMSAALQLSLRPATLDDAAFLLALANDPAVRAASFSTAPIGWDEHVRWLTQVIAEPDVDVLVVLQAGRPVGNLRFQRRGDAAIISVSLEPAARGMGLAAAAIDAGCRELFATSAVDRVVAEIKEDNAASVSAFADAGFGEQRRLADRPRALQMTLRRVGAGVED